MTKYHSVKIQRKRQRRTGTIPLGGGGLGHGPSVATYSAGHRGVLVGAPVAAWTGTYAQLDRLTAEHLSVSLQREDDLDRTPTETTHARAEAHELEQVRHPVRSSCSHRTDASSLTINVDCVQHFVPS